MENLEWHPQGDSMLSWINDFEVLEISPVPADSIYADQGCHKLSISHLGRGGVHDLGYFHQLSEAKNAADAFLQTRRAKHEHP